MGVGSTGTTHLSDILFQNPHMCDEFSGFSQAGFAGTGTGISGTMEENNGSTRNGR